MRIKSVTLENFRCFRETNLDLSADIVAIYGRNGVGKTAIFDAFEFALLGSIGRFSGEANPPNYLPCVSSYGDIRIRIEFTSNNSDWVEVTRGRLPDGKLGMKSNGGWTNHREFLYGYLMNEHYTPPRREVDLIAELFRSTMLLSQDTIRKFVEGGAGERARVLSHMAGSAYLQRCLDKSEEVVKEAKAREQKQQVSSAEVKASLDELKKKLAEKETRIVLYREKLGAPTIPRDTIIREAESMGISADSMVFQKYDNDEALIASIRLICEERMAAIDDQMKQLAELEAASHQHPARVERRQGLIEMVQKAKKDITKLLDRENSAGGKVETSKRKIVELDVRINGEINRLKKLHEFQELQKKWVEYNKLKDITLSEITELRGKLESIRVVLETHQDGLKRAKENVGVYRTQVDQTSLKLERFKALRISLSEYVRSKNLVQEIETRIVSLKEQRDAKESLEKELRERYYTLNEKISGANRVISEKQSSVQESQNLASSLKQYANGKECPLCGHSYPSQEAMQKAIESHLVKIPEELLQAAKELHGFTEEFNRVNSNLSTIVKDKKQIDVELLSAETERELLLSFLRKTESDADALNVSLDDKALDASIHKYQKMLVADQTTLEETKNQVEEAMVRSKSLVAEKDSIEGALEVKIKFREEVQRQLDSVELRIAELGLSKMDEIENDWLIKAIGETTSSLAGLEKEKSAEETIKATAEAEWNSSRSERMKIESNVNEWEKTLARLSAEIEEFRFRCKNLGLESDARTDTIAAHQARFNQEKDKVVAVRKLVDRYEWSFRINTLEKEQDELLQQLDIMIRTSDKNQKQITRLRNAVKEAESWIPQLTESVKRAVEIQIAEHQPQILRLFKSMIPSPYLFQSVTMKHGRNGLELGLHYQGQEQSAGEPHFFLSCAQANVLALSIFLSLAGKQRWSKLDALFLDDPVQHLDDLNAVAFLDNLRAVSLGKFGPKRQIIVSTCDQNLYLLMIRKFRMLETAGIKFMGISLLDRGIEGPEIYYDAGGPRDRVTFAATA